MVRRRPLPPLALISLVLACTPTPTPEPSAAASPKQPAKTEPVKIEPAVEPTVEPAAEPEPALEPVATGPSDLVQLPFYWAEVEDSKIVFDAHDISESEYEPLSPLEFDGTLVLEAGDPRIPARFAYGQSFVITSEGGRVNAKVEQVALTMADGVFMNVTLAPDGPLVAENGMMVFPAAAMPADAKVRLPSHVAPDDPSFTKILENVNAALTKGKLPKATASELQVERVTMQGDVRFIVAVQVFNGNDPDDTDSSTVPTGLAFADANGAIVEWIRPLEVELEAYAVELVFDLDGDGLDELVYLASYGEGSFWNLLRLDPAEPTKYTSLVIAGYGL